MCHEELKVGLKLLLRQEKRDPLGKELFQCNNKSTYKASTDFDLELLLNFNYYLLIWHFCSHNKMIKMENMQKI